MAELFPAKQVAEPMATNSFKKDSELLDKILVLRAGVSRDPEIIKSAGIADTLGGMAESLTAQVKESIQERGIAESIFQYLTEATLMAVFRPLGITVALLRLFFDIDVGDILSKASQLLNSKLNTQGYITEEDAADISRQATSSIAATASLDILREMEKSGEMLSIMKQAWPGKSRYSSKPGILDWANIFSILRGKRGFFGIGRGLIAWFISAVVLGFVGVEGTELLKNKLTGPKTEEEPKEEKSEVEMIGVPQALVNFYTKKTEPQQAPAASFPKTTHDFKPSGKGETYFINTPQNQWWADIPNGDVERALVYWAKTIYPEIIGKEKDLINLPAFRQTANLIKAGYNPNTKDWVKIPPSNVHTWKDIVDSFVGDLNI